MTSGKNFSRYYLLKNLKQEDNYDHRKIINGILWIDWTGALWRDLPPCYGVHTTVSSRFDRWRTAGLWSEILAKLQTIADYEGQIDWEVHMVDSTVVRAPMHAAGAKGSKKTKL